MALDPSLTEALEEKRRTVFGLKRLSDEMRDLRGGYGRQEEEGEEGEEGRS